MKPILLIMIILPFQQLTWYELYERGEKAFNRSRYQDCISDMRAALEENDQPGRNVFTRAVQKIDYKPYYYLALGYYHLEDLPAAFENAQKAFESDVVGQDPALQHDLSKILTAYREWVGNQHERYTREMEFIRQRNRLLEQVSRGRISEVNAFLAGTEEPERFKDIQLYLSLRQDWIQQQDDVQQDLLARLEGWLADGETEKARTLFESLRDNLPGATIDMLEARFAAIPPPVKEIIETPEPVVSEEEIPERETLDPGLIDFYRSELNKVQQQKTQLDERVTDFTRQNRELRRELEKKAEPTSFQPQLVLSLTGKFRTLAVEGHVVSPMQISRWALTLNGSALEIPESALIQNGVDFRLDREFRVDAFGDQTVTLTVADELGRQSTTSKTFFLPTPWFLNRALHLLAVSIFSLAFLMFIIFRAGRRKAAQLRHFNPYIAGSPVREEQMFFGRNNLLHRIQNLVHKNSFMIHGNRRIGKTSLLMQLHMNLAEMNSSHYRFYPAFIDLQGVTEDELFHHMMAEVVSAMDDWGVDESALRFRDDHENYQSRHFSKDVKTIIEQLKTRESRHVILVLLMDEVDVLNEFSEKTNQKLRGIFMKDFAEHLSCVMAGIHLKREWESSGSPWYNFFEEIPVNPIDEQAARRLIVDPVSGIFTYSRDAVSLIINETGGHPYLIQKLCVSLIGEKLKNRHYKISRDDVLEAMKVIREETVRSHT